ncbi:protein disulfide-isomerase hypothetical protein [Limosa lapponica baueri]|uniref:Calsequestrin n=1 Tax=Limosa lapponica baueri TaxID=1758121 RepID=A0A2I0TB52_LIMLA|nr:protein disulfide-isomerase hypothetical protein [Limosa lapponica baueri]
MLRTSVRRHPGNAELPLWFCLTLFYLLVSSSDRCGHCKQFAPEYEKIAKTLKENDPPIPVAKVDATAATSLASRFDVSGYPTIKILKKGQPVDYDGSRTEDGKHQSVAILCKKAKNYIVLLLNVTILTDFDLKLCYLKQNSITKAEILPVFSIGCMPENKFAGIVDYMIEQAGPPSKQIQATKQVQEFLRDGDDVIIIGVFSGENDKAYQLYQEAANGLREDYKFHHTFSNEIAKLLKVSPGKLVVMQPEKFQSKHEPKMHVLDLKYWRGKVLEVAKDFPEYVFAVSDEEDYSSEIKDLGLLESGEDVNVAILDEGGKKYAMEPEEFDSDVLKQFVVAFKKGKLKPIVKSQPVPKNNKGPVKVVVGKTFDTIVMDPKNDVLIEFYAPWCGHCKKLEPVYTELGKKYKNEKNLVIAKMDATANDVMSDRYKVEGFPTIYFAPRDKKNNPIKFEGGDRDLEHLSKFIEEHATKLSRTKEEL